MPVANPYASPESVRRKKRPPRRAVFEVGTSERHVVEVFLSQFGTEVYAVDDVEVLRLKSMSVRGTRQFEVGQSERHLVEVKLDMMPSWKCFAAPNWTAEVYVDGQLMVAELFPEMRRSFGTIHHFLKFLFIITLGLLALLALVILAIVALFTFLPVILSLFQSW